MKYGGAHSTNVSAVGRILCPWGENKATHRSIRFCRSRESQEAAEMSSVLSIVQRAHWVLCAPMLALYLLSRNLSEHCLHFPFALMSPCVDYCVGRPHQHAVEWASGGRGERAAQHQFIVEFV